MSFLFQTEALKIGRMKWLLSSWGRYCHTQPISLKYEFVPLMILQSSLCAQNAVSSCGEVLGTEACWTETSPSPCFLTWVWSVSPSSPLPLPSPESFSPVELLYLSAVAFCRQVVADLQEACNGVRVFEYWRELELISDFLSFQWAKGMQLCNRIYFSIAMLCVMVTLI